MFLSLPSSHIKSIKKRCDNPRLKGEPICGKTRRVRTRRETLEPAASEASYVAERLKQLGVLTGIDGPFRNVLKIKPPMVFTQADADRLTNTLVRVLAEPRLTLLRSAL